MTFIGNEKDFIDVLAALGPFIVGLAVAYVAWQQWQTSEKQRRQNYLDHYFNVYENLTKAIGEVLTYGKVTEIGQKLFWKARDEARLFLDDEISTYVEDILGKARESFILNIRLKNIPIGEERTKKVNKMSKLNEFLYDLKPHEKFQKFMRFD